MDPLIDPVAEMPMIIFSVLVIILILVVVFVSQRYKYQGLKDDLRKYLKQLNNQEKTIKKLEDELREYMMGGKGLRDWSMVKQQINELSDLPLFIETDEEYTLKTHLSRIKKDNVNVSGTGKEIRISIDSGSGPPLNAVYSTPNKIDPHGLKVTYRGNTLEIKAPRVIAKDKDKVKKSKKE